VEEGKTLIPFGNDKRRKLSRRGNSYRAKSLPLSAEMASNFDGRERLAAALVNWLAGAISFD
jgi:hypothetical protein